LTGFWSDLILLFCSKSIDRSLDLDYDVVCFDDLGFDYFSANLEAEGSSLT